MNLAQEVMDELCSEPDRLLSDAGFELPEVFAFCQGGEILYTKTRSATWDRVMAAQSQFEGWASAIEKLRPVMESDPGITVEQAIAKMRQAVAV